MTTAARHPSSNATPGPATVKGSPVAIANLTSIG
jgi:hypothetical protein